MLFTEDQGLATDSKSQKSICPRTEANDHPVSLGMTCGQYVESPSWIYRREFFLKLLATQVSLDVGFAMIVNCWGGVWGLWWGFYYSATLYMIVVLIWSLKIALFRTLELLEIYKHH